MSDSFSAFERALGEGDIAFFFFAGHGFEIKGENYLLPTDVPMALAGEEEKVHENSFLRAPRILDRMRARACAPRSWCSMPAATIRSSGRAPARCAARGGLAPMSDDGAFVIYSASENQTALDYTSDDDKDPNSVFTRYFVQGAGDAGPLAGAGRQAHAGQRHQAGAQVQARAEARLLRRDRGRRGAERHARSEQGEGDDPAAGRRHPGAAVKPLPRRDAPPSDQLNAPLANFMRHNGGWSVTLSFADPVTAISWRFGEKGNFKETGFLDTLDPRTRKRMPNPSLQLDNDAPEGTIYVRYAGHARRMGGAVPDQVRARMRSSSEGHRQILEMTSSNWLSFREFNGLMVYWSHLLSYRCAIREVKIGIDTTVPDKKLALPPCDPKDPSAIPYKRDALSQAAARNQVDVRRVDLSRRQAVGDQELPALTTGDLARRRDE